MAAFAVALLCLACAGAVGCWPPPRVGERPGEGTAHDSGRAGDKMVDTPGAAGGEGFESGDAPGDTGGSPSSDEVLRRQEELGWAEELLASEAASAREQEGSVEEVASSVLASYRDRGDCVLASSGYLDLLGSVWACVVRGGAWADVCIVSGDAEAGHCQVLTLRLERDELVQLLEEEKEVTEPS